MDEYNRHPAFRLHKGAAVYAALMVFAIVFTQALRSPASSLVFWFVFLYPLAALIYTFFGKLAIQVYVTSEITQAQKMTPVDYEIRVVNGVPLAYPFVEAILQMPREDGIRCAEQPVHLSLIPMGSYSICRTTEFRYRGTYDIGIRCLYVSDFLHLFSMRSDVEIFNSVLVFPRRLDMTRKTKTSATDIPNDNAAVVFSTEKAEIGNIREYIPGDTLKSIHWKLSSKTPETLMVKEFNTNTSRQVYMLCDFSRSLPTEVFEKEEERLEREKREKEEAKKRKKKSRHVRLKAILTAEEKNIARQEKAERKRKKRRLESGMSGVSAGDASMIDDLIRDTAAPVGIAAAVKENRILQKWKNKLQEKAADQVEEMDTETVEKNISDEDRSSLAIGGRIRSDCLTDMDEYCADGVVEMGIAAIRNELKQGNEVHLLWTDRRMDEGVAEAHLTCPEDFEEIYTYFATTPPCPPEQSVVSLLPMIHEALNVTIRICTANIDPLSLSYYGTIPSLFGGAGNSCVAEVLLFNPEERYEKISVRREYVEMSRITLAKDGVDLTELTVTKDENGNSIVDVANRNS